MNANSSLNSLLPESVARSSSSGLTFKVWDSFHALENQRTAWDDAVLALGGSVYMTYDWCRLWWQFYGLGKQLRIAIFSREERIVGILPIYLDEVGVRPFSVRIARLVGANIPPKVFNPPVEAGDALEIFQILLTRLFEHDQCDLLSFGPVCGLHQASDFLARACERMPQMVGNASSEESVHSIFLLPSSMEEYYAGLGKNERKNRRKYELRLLGKEYEVMTDVVKEPAAAAVEFERFALQHAVQWRAQGKPGHFGAWPRALEFNRAIVQAQAQLGRIRFWRIIANGEIISSQYAFVLGDACYWELPARSIGSSWERFSLGPTGIVNMIAAGIDEKLSHIEGGLAHYDYKLRLNAKEHPVRIVRVIGNSARSRVRVRLLKTWRLLLLWGYHKLWYRRIAPRLGSIAAKPQWQHWLRLDF